MRRFVGMTNQLSKFVPCSAVLMKSLTELLSSKIVFQRGPSQTKAFADIKEKLTNAPVLAPYDPQSETKDSADASSFGLGVVILQKAQNDTVWKPVAFASCTMTSTEVHYGQIEKEALALTWACEKFSMYLIGKSFILETDHNPLISLLGNKNLDSLPPRVLCFKLLLMRYNFSIIQVAGKALTTADTLSRAPLQLQSSESSELQDVVESFVSAVVEAIPASSDHLEQIHQAQKEDPTLSQVMKYCQEGRPAKHNIKGLVKQYWLARSELCIHDELLLHTDRIVIPTCLQQDILSHIHQGHQGIVKLDSVSVLLFGGQACLSK